MVTRRDALRTLVLTALAPPLVSGCGGDGVAGAAAGPDAPTSDVARSAGRPDAVPEVVAALHRLAGGLYGPLARQPGPLVLSPYSVAVALAMTLPGAAGRTAAEMRDVLGVADDDLLHGGLNALAGHLDGLAGPQDRVDGSVADVVLAGANQLFGQQGVRWERELLDLLAREHGAGLRTVDFERDPEQARRLVNDWVSSRTADRIPELVPPDVFDEWTRLVLVNALYLQAPWDVPFDPSLTEVLPFSRPDGGVVEVDTMVQPALVTTLVEGHGWRAARLPYAGGALAMTLVLPDPGRAEDVTRLLTSGAWGDLLSAGRPAVLDLRLPRWSTRTAVPLVEVLQQLGMVAAFDDTLADLRPMTEDDLELYVSAVLHEGFVAVDESGTEAAAATAVVVSEESAPPPAERFHVDRPFVFVVHDVEHGTPLFLGRVEDPGA